MTNPTGDAAKDLGDKVLPQADVANEDEWRHAQPELSNEHLEILRHTRDRAAGGFYCGDSAAMQELVRMGLVRMGLMEYAGRKSFGPDLYFKLTEAGRRKLDVYDRGN